MANMKREISSNLGVTLTIHEINCPFLVREAGDARIRLFGEHGIPSIDDLSAHFLANVEVVPPATGSAGSIQSNGFH